MSRVLWPHQEEAVQAVVAEVAHGGRCNVVMACGTGKTNVGAEVSRQLAQAGRVLIVVPTIALANQMANNYADYLGSGVGRVIAVCSDNTAASLALEELDADLARVDGEATTDPRRLIELLTAPGRATVITTYHSLGVIAEVHQEGIGLWDLMVVDEAHRSAGRVGRTWSILHDDARIPAKRRLYMTATPRMMSSERYETFSMDDPAVFGPTVSRLEFGKAIAQGWLADYHVAVVVVSDQEVASLVAGGDLLTVDGYTVPADMLAKQVALLRACADHNLKRVITYHRRVLSAKRFAETLPNAAALEGRVPLHLLHADHVSGDMTLKARRTVLQMLDPTSRKTVVVANARVLTEGVDVPELDAVMFTDPRDSGTDVVQAVGRALRRGTSENKIATIIVPIVLTPGQSAEAALESSQFDMVWRVVRALRAHDERLADWLDDHRVRYTTRDKDPEQRGPLEPPAWLTLSGAAVPDGFASALTLRILQTTTTGWLDHYAAARAFHAKHGHLKVPRSYDTNDGLRLHFWLTDQRHQRKMNRLPDERFRLLDALGMEWDLAEARWREGLKQAKAYVTEHGHLWVPPEYVTADGYPLDAWLKTQRMLRRTGALAPERETALTKIGIVWEPRKNRTQQFLDRLAAYAAKHGHANVLDNYVSPDGYALGQALGDRRRAWKDGKLPADQVAALQRLGVPIDPVQVNGDQAFQAWLQRLRTYAATHGDHNPSRRYVTPDGYALGNWLSSLRVKYREGQLAAKQIAELEKLGVKWNPRASGWQTGIDHLRAYVAKHGHGDVPNLYVCPDGYRLGWWLMSVRRRQGQGRVLAARVEELRKLGARLNPDAPPPPQQLSRVDRRDLTEDEIAKLRALPREQLREPILALIADRVPQRQIYRALGVGPNVMARILSDDNGSP